MPVLRSTAGICWSTDLSCPCLHCPSESLAGLFSAQEDADLSPAGCAQWWHGRDVTGGLCLHWGPPGDCLSSSHGFSWWRTSLPALLSCRAFAFLLPPLHFAANLEPVVSQNVGGGTVGENLCGLNSHLLPSLRWELWPSRFPLLRLRLRANSGERCVCSFILLIDRWDPTASSLMQSQTPQLASFPLFCQE